MPKIIFDGFSEAQEKHLRKRLADDPTRCRYTDCPESWRLATDEEKITCPTCREWMALPEED